MPCYHPIHAYKDKSTDSGKTVVVFNRNDSWRGERLELPCGQCIGCRLERARQWALRCVHESQLYERNCFITLTYDERHLPKATGVCGVCKVRHAIAGSVCVSEFQRFMKRLRRAYGPGIRFFHCGEYGDENRRPHYHALLFNHDFEDKKVFSGDSSRRVYTSDALAALWPLGFSTVGDVTFESAGYVARYSLKKVTGKKQEAFYGGRRPEYCTMSRRPGIGARWFERFSGDVYPVDRVVHRGVCSRPPRYYDGLLGRVDPALLASLKIEREKNEKFVSDVLSDGKIIRVSDSCDRRLAVKEIVKAAQVSVLSRHKDGVI